MSAFLLGVALGCLLVQGVYWYEGWWRREEQRRRTGVPVSPTDLELTYGPLYARVLAAERAGLISGREAEEAFRALVEAESLEWLFLSPAGPDGPGEQTL